MFTYSGQIKTDVLLCWTGKEPTHISVCLNETFEEKGIPKPFVSVFSEHVAKIWKIFVYVSA